MPQDLKITKIYLKHQIEIVDCGIGRFELKMTKKKNKFMYHLTTWSEKNILHNLFLKLMVLIKCGNWWKWEI